MVLVPLTLAALPSSPPGSGKFMAELAAQPGHAAAIIQTLIVVQTRSADVVVPASDHHRRAR
jgi:hypothetical protein